MRLLTVVAAMLMLSVFAYAAPIWQNDITGTAPGQINPYTTNDVFEPNLSVSGIGRSAEVGGGSGDDRYNTNTWSVSTLTATKYLTFTLTPASGYYIHFTDFDFYTQKSSTGPTNFALRSSIDGFTTDIFSGTISSTTNTRVNIALSAAQFLNVNTAVEFRLYAWGASGGTGTFSINSFSFNGTISNTPLPVVFGNISAWQQNNQVEVAWSTLSETNNKQFEVEGSSDGIHFSLLKIVPTVNGNSSIAQHYKTEVTVSERMIALQWMALLFLLPFLYKKGRSKILAVVVIGLFCLQGTIACTKSSGIEKSDPVVFIRIKQVDVDENYRYSKTVRAIIRPYN